MFGSDQVRPMSLLTIRPQPRQHLRAKIQQSGGLEMILPGYACKTRWLHLMLRIAEVSGLPFFLNNQFVSHCLFRGHCNSKPVF